MPWCSSGVRRRRTTPGTVILSITITSFPDLSERYADVLEAVEATEGWITSVRASSPPMTLLGQLGGIEAGLRQ